LQRNPTFFPLLKEYSMANTTQGLAIALFGAYAGGYTAQLDADIAKSGLGPVAESLIGLQGPLLGLDLSDDSTFIDVVLGNLGVDSTNAAYSAAVAWFEGAVASMGRGAAVAAAVNFLLGDSVDAAYASVATAFAADVAAGATWSATTAGAAEFSVADLRVAAGNPSTGTGFNLTAALNAIDSASDSLKAFLAALDLNADGKADFPKATTVAADATAADAALDAAVAANGGTLVAYGYNAAASDAVNAAALALADAQLDAELAADQKALDKLNAYVTAYSKTAAGVGADAAVAKLAAADAANTAAAKAAVTAQADLASAYAKVVTTTAAPADALFVDPGVDVVIDVDGTAGGVDETVVATFNGTTKVYELATGIDDTDYVGITAYVAALNAKVAADKAATAANDVEVAAQADVDAYVGDVDTDTAGSQDLGDVAAAITAKAAEIKIDNDAIAAYDKAVAAFNKVDTLDTERTALEKAVTDAKKAVATAGYTMDDLDGTAADGTVGNDVYMYVGATDAIDNFGLQGNDVLFVGADYAFNAGKLAAGDNAKLEVFFAANALTSANTDVIVEDKAYGSESGATHTITLVGVTVAELEFANGYVQLA
jgi:hypothetical protein